MSENEVDDFETNIELEDVDEKQPKKKYYDNSKEFRKAPPDLIFRKIEELIEDERNIVDFIYNKFVGFDFLYQVKTIFITDELTNDMIAKLINKLIKSNKAKLAKRETELQKLFSGEKNISQQNIEQNI